jgi:uncharacterized membrane protein YoaK (UPF0700 family)
MHRYDRSRRALAFAIAGLGGFVDAIGFLAADGYFVSFMSGNTTRLGVDLATAPWRALTPAALIGGFVAGVTLGALLADWAGERRKSMVTTLAGLLLLGAAVSRQIESATGFLACTVIAMGVLNNSFRQGGEVAVGVTYMTGALVRFGQGLAARMRGTPRERWLANGGLWLSLAAGAIGGAACFAWLPAWSGWIAFALACAIVLGALIIEHRAGIAQSS